MALLKFNATKTSWLMETQYKTRFEGAHHAHWKASKYDESNYYFYCRGLRLNAKEHVHVPARVAESMFQCVEMMESLILTFVNSTARGRRPTVMVLSSSLDQVSCVSLNVPVPFIKCDKTRPICVDNVRLASTATFALIVNQSMGVIAPINLGQSELV